MKNILDGINDGLHSAEEKLSKTESITIGTTENDAREKNKQAVHL